MYFFIPFGIFVLSSVAIVWIVVRKFVYLKKLAPETLETSLGDQGGFWEELFPQIADWLKNVNLRKHGVDLLNEFEKLLRKLRLISLKIDALTNRLIHRVRKSTKEHEAILVKEAEKALEEEKISETENNDWNEPAGTPEELKQKEQLLIIEIAKNPKDSQLYKELGNVYMRTGEWEDAKQSFEKAVEFDPADETVKRKLGRVISKIEEQEKI